MADASISALGVGAGLLVDGIAYAYGPTDPWRALGPILAWAHRSDAERLHLFVDDAEAAVGLAGRAAHLEPSPSIWLVEGRTATAAEPAAPPPIVDDGPPARAEVRELVSLLERHGLEVSAEHGVITGQRHGLEVARVLDDELGVGLAVGVGHFDREAGAMLRGDRSDADALTDAVAQIEPIRSASGPPAHPLNRLVRERWLRSSIVTDPGLVGLDQANAIASLRPPANLLEANPASAVGLDSQGARVLVVCALGTNLDVVSVAAGQVASQAAAGSPVERVVVAVPQGDTLPITQALAGYLRPPAAVVEVPPPWPR